MLMFCSPKNRLSRQRRRWSTIARALKRQSRCGPKGFKEYAGHFWGFLETRPYTHARAGLAAILNALGNVDAAIGNYRDMLRLNPNDNQGIRYELASCLMKSGDTEALKELLKEYDEDGSALWLYTQALLAYRESKADKKAEELAKKAVRSNRHVPGALAGTKKVKSSSSGYLTMGGEDEAAHYVQEWGFDWLTTPRSIGLRQSRPKLRRRRRRNGDLRINDGVLLIGIRWSERLNGPRMATRRLVASCVAGGALAFRCARPRRHGRFEKLR